jgi:type I restriction enzyme S subunit
MRDLLDPSSPFDKGTEPGSVHYLPQAPCRLIRTKALQEHSCLLYPKGDAITAVNPKVFVDYGLSDGDILMSKDSNVGEVAMVDGQRWRDCMFSSGVVRLNPVIDRNYLFAFLKHPLFKAQLRAKAPRGATITHAKALWLDCLIPFPRQPDADRVTAYVSALALAIVEKEKAIRERADTIRTLIADELLRNQRPGAFRFAHPSMARLRQSGRLDAAIYDHEYMSKIHLVENYARGHFTPLQAGFTVTPGPSLEIKLLRTRLDSDHPKPGFYALLLPTNISEYGTLNAVPFLGTPRKLPLLQRGDVLFGEAGFQKGRSLVLLDDIPKCTTNAHGLCARRSDCDIETSVYFRCVFDWYRSMRLVDLMAVGGSGGHFSPEYFEYVKIPDFPPDARSAIVSLYHRSAPPPRGEPVLKTFVDRHSEWNASLGIWELDREMKLLQVELRRVQEQIISGEAVVLPSWAAH